ncbi:fetuin-B-like [Erpetoichthys calabaricus]|uniref:fetuin-B-like n=1 Tax=Erpetoichthys calabaricus TaxID=27687 RepID=UPI0022343998|nr:fetuin-B-like [Erpetoichthys calabaricus]
MKLLIVTVVVTLLAKARCQTPVVENEPLREASCNDSLVTMAAGIAVREINKRQDEGNILALYRINDAHVQNKGMGNTFYLNLHVLDTDCNVLSRKDFTQCNTKQFFETVYGTCKAVIYINRVNREIDLYSYNCSLAPIPKKTVLEMCPDCPLSGSSENSEYLATAKKTLLKFNKESNNTKLFAVKKITKTSMQWVVGASYFVSYVIYETGCGKEILTEDFICEIENPDGRFGFCKGSRMLAPDGPHISVSCEIFPPEEDRGRCHRHRHKHRHRHGHGHGHDHNHGRGHDHGAPSMMRGPGHERGHKHGHSHGHKHGHGHGHKHGHGHGHDHKHKHEHGEGDKGHTSGWRGCHRHNHTHGHGSGSHEHSHEHGHHNDSSQDLNFHDPLNQNEGSVFIFPQTSDPVDHPDPVLNLPPFAKDADILPFPDKSSTSILCPGEPKLSVNWITDFGPKHK